MIHDEFTASEDTLLCAFRYALGKRNLVVGNIVRDLSEAAESLSSDTRQTMIKEINQKWQVNALGHENDRRQWVNLLKQLNEVEEDQKLL